MTCGIMHKHGGQTCERPKGHDGPCRTKSQRHSDGTINYSEWESRNGEFVRHVGYRTIYPRNAEVEA